VRTVLGGVVNLTVYDASPFNSIIHSFIDIIININSSNNDYYGEKLNWATLKLLNL